MQEQKKIRAVFMGTPHFAELILERLLEAEDVDIVAVYCQPDRPSGRGKQVQAPPVKRLAEKHGLPVIQPLSFRNAPAELSVLASWEADVFIVAAYGLILPQSVLDIPKLMPINIHGSLLPKYRGAAPVQRAIMAGDTVTGATIMRMEAGLDTGPMLAQRALGIGINDNSEDILAELAVLGADLLLETLQKIKKGMQLGIAQDDTLANYAAKLSKEEAFLRLGGDALHLHAQIRGLSPWPGASLVLSRKDANELTVKLSPAEFPLSQDFLDWLAPFSGAKAGDILGLWQDSLVVACGGGAYPFPFLQPAGKQKMTGKAFFHGYIKKKEEAFFISS